MVPGLSNEPTIATDSRLSTVKDLIRFDVPVQVQGTVLRYLDSEFGVQYIVLLLCTIYSEGTRFRYHPQYHPV